MIWQWPIGSWEGYCKEGKGPRRSLLLFGYAGWAPGQLEGEIARRSWVAVPADEALVFDGQYETKWMRAYRAEDDGTAI